jgi:hypothetical protein
MIRSIGWLVLLALALMFGPAEADTDQRCLSACIAGGQTATACLPQCSYNVKPKADTSTVTEQAPVDPNRVLDTPSPSDDLVLPTPPAPKPPAMHLDRVCLSDCVKDSFQYDLCKERCTKADCVGNSPSCGQSSVMTLNKAPQN